MNRPGRPGSRATTATVDGYLGWLARTLRYDAHDQGLITAAGFARALAELPGATAVGPAMISRLEGGTAHWRVEHLVSYARVLALPPSRLLAPAYKVGKLLGVGVAGLLRVRYSDEDEQTVADLIDALYGDDPINTDNWDVLSGYLLVTRRKVGMRTWGLLCERLLLEICATQGVDQDIRAEALVRLMSLDRVAEIVNEFAVGTAEQPGNPMSFMPLKIFQRMPRKAPSRWIVRALLNPPDRWLLRELFTSVDVLVDSGLWQPSTPLLSRLRAESIDATLDAGTEMEIRRSSLHLLHTLDPSAAQRVLLRVGDGELVYRAKPDQATDAQQSRYREFAERFATQLQELGPRWRGKWAAGEDRVLVDVVTQTLFGRGATHSGHTTLLTNSGYLDALRETVTRHLTDLGTYQDVTLARAVVRLAGKVAASPQDGHTLLSLIASPRLDVDTRVQTCWASPTPPPDCPEPS